MSWTDVSFDEVQSGKDELPVGDYVFMVTGAGPNRFKKNGVDVRLNVASGEFAGVSDFLRYPDPAVDTKQPTSSPFNWVNKSMKQLLDAFEAKGHMIEKGEHPIDFINRATKAADAAGEAVYINAKVTSREYQDKTTQELKHKTEVSIRSVKVHQE